MIRRFLAAALLVSSSVVAQAPSIPASVPAISEETLENAFRALAADSMEGRRVETEGNARARKYLLGQLARIGIKPLVPGFTYPFSASFSARSRLPTIYGTNVLAVVRGTKRPGRYIIVTAHYDHLGIVQGEIYPGADDNASGSAAILAIAEWTQSHPPENSIIFAWFDGEEEGLLGSLAFVKKPPVPLDSIVADVNLDMVSRSVKSELFASGANRWPVMQPFIDSIAALKIVTLRQGHDRSQDGQDEWTDRSDMGPFNAKHIPYVHFGVEEHPAYHQPTDRAEYTDINFYFHNVLVVSEMLRRMDASLDIIEKARRAR